MGRYARAKAGRIPDWLRSAKDKRLEDHGARLSRSKKRKKPLRGNAYRKRNSVLKRMGFVSYREYLRSDLWATIRSTVIEATPTCELCLKNHAATVHHIAYNRQVLSGRVLRKLVAICEMCHLKVEFKSNGDKREFEAAMKTTRRILRRNGRWSLHVRQRQVHHAADSEQVSHGERGDVTELASVVTEASDSSLRKQPGEGGGVPDGASDKT